MRYSAFIITAFLISPGSFSAQHKSVPRFEDYRVNELFRGRLAPVKLTDKRSRMFRTKLRESAARGTNFAGHYIAATWGCGSACWSFAIIDARRGRVYFIPSLLSVGRFGHSQEDLIQFRKDSRLLIVDGAPNDESPEGRYYYVWKNNQLKLIRGVQDRTAR